MTSLKNQTIAGVSWIVIAQLGLQITSFLTTLVLARLLSPDDYGLLGMVVVFTGLVAVFQNLGLGPSIIHDRDINEIQLSGLFWLNLIFSCVLALVTILMAPIVSRFYEQPELLTITIVLAARFPIVGCVMVPRALLQKNMSFRQIAISSNISTAIASLAGIWAAALGYGVWALVLQLVLSDSLTTILLWYSASWRPRLLIPSRGLGKQLRYGMNIQAGSLLNYGTRNADDLIVGRVIGVGSLGIYQMAYRLMLWPLQKVTGIIGQVMFPVLSKVQNETKRFKSIYLRSVGVIALVTFPIAFGMWIISPLFIPTFLGTRWIGVVPIFRILCILVVPQAIGRTTGWIFLSRGRPDIRLRLQLAFTIVFITSFIVGVNWGIIGVAICYTLASLLLMPIQFQIAGRLIGITFFDIARIISRSGFSAVGMSLIVWSVGQLVPAAWPEWFKLCLLVSTGMISYVILIHLLHDAAYIELRKMLFDKLQNIPPSRSAEC